MVTIESIYIAVNITLGLIIALGTIYEILKHGPSILYECFTPNTTPEERILGEEFEPED